MGQKIVVLGNMPGGDAARLGRLAERFGLELLAVRYDTDAQQLPAAGEDPVGVVSYLSYDQEHLASIFDTRPPGFDGYVPLYQCIAPEGIPSHFYRFPLHGVFTSPISEAAAMNILLSARRNRDFLDKQYELQDKLASDRDQKDRLARVGMAFCNESDYTSLIKLILSVSRDVTRADAASLYTRERMVDNALCGLMHFSRAQCGSFDAYSPAEKRIKVGPETLVGCAAYTGQFLEVHDVEKIRPDAPFKLDRSFNCYPGYACKSVLTMPLKNMEDEVVAVLQLMNKKPEPDAGAEIVSAEDAGNYARPFTSEDIGIIRFLARYAAVSLERVVLYDTVEQ